jgi:predicted neuraminidase
MTPKAATALSMIELRLTGGLLALNRLIMTFQNKRMPVAGFTVGHDRNATRATILLDCSPQTARRYTALLSTLEDVEEIKLAGETVEVALVKTGDDGWRELAPGISAHEEGGTVVASGDLEKMEAWLGSLQVEDIVRLGPIARPGDGGV